MLPGMVIALACAPPACAAQASTPADATSILFIGNSLTYANDLPSLVRADGARRGFDVRVRMIAHPNYSLEDHWHLGIADSIEHIRADYVVMQQGPSSLAESRAELIQWSDSIARGTRAAGGEPVMLMVWPPLEREFAWDAVRDSYVAAGEAIGARVVPAGERIRARRTADPAARLFAADGFHPALEGSREAASAIVDVLFEGPS